ncbi:MAG: hypothetical protein ACK587_17240 [Cyanobacteriota bacterium]|jgi:hypothetical protein
MLRSASAPIRVDRGRKRERPAVAESPTGCGRRRDAVGDEGSRSGNSCKDQSGVLEALMADGPSQQNTRSAGPGCVLAAPSDQAVGAGGAAGAGTWGQVSIGTFDGIRGT